MAWPLLVKAGLALRLLTQAALGQGEMKVSRTCVPPIIMTSPSGSRVGVGYHLFQDIVLTLMIALLSLRGSKKRTLNRPDGNPAFYGHDTHKYIHTHTQIGDL